MALAIFAGITFSGFSLPFLYLLTLRGVGGGLSGV